MQRHVGNEDSDDRTVTLQHPEQLRDLGRNESPEEFSDTLPQAQLARHELAVDQDADIVIKTTMSPIMTPWGIELCC